MGEGFERDRIAAFERQFVENTNRVAASWTMCAMPIGRALVASKLFGFFFKVLDINEVFFQG
jgi:hypothetical protein